MGKVSTRAAKNKLEKFKKQQMLGLSGMDDSDEVAVLPSSSASKFSFNLAKSVSTRELVNPQLDNIDKTDLYTALRNDPDIANHIGKVPKYLMYDIYSLFNNPMNIMKFGKVDENNSWQYKLLQRLNNCYLRTVTENSMPYSYLTTNEYVKMLWAKIEEEQQKNPGKSEEDILKDWMQEDEKSKAKSGSSLQKAIDNANKKIEEKMKDVKEKGGMLAGSTDELQDFKDVNTLFDALKYLKHINVNAGMIQKFIQKSLKFSTGYFSSAYRETEESIFDADDMDGLYGLENLIPVLKKTQLLELTTSLRKYNLNFDVYIDNSGSMDSRYGIGGGAQISAFDLCKLTALKMANLGFGKDVYLFNDRVTKLPDLKKILPLKTHGGTNTECVIRHIIQTGRPGLILTDMCDRITTYTSNAYFIGVNGANFSGMQRDAERYITKKQIIKYEGEKFSRA